MEVFGAVFQGLNHYGDFGWMVTQQEYSDAFFVFNDNEEQYLLHRDNPNAPQGCSAGGGNASIRPCQCKNPPRAGGVPTGSKGGGYTSLTPAIKAIIDEAVASIEKACKTYNFNRLYYNSDGHGSLGTGIFKVGDDVKDYIVQQLKALGA
jgi:hypothetical protein